MKPERKGERSKGKYKRREVQNGNKRKRKVGGWQKRILVKGQRRKEDQDRGNKRGRKGRR